MAGHKLLTFLVLALTISFTSAARLLDEGDAPAATTVTGSGPLPTTGSGPLPTAGVVPLATSGSGPLPIAGPVPLPTAGSGPQVTGPSAGVGPVLGGSGSLPTTGSGPLPTTGSGPLPTTGSGPLPTTGSGPLPTTGPGPLPTTGSGPLPTAGTGPAATGAGAGAGPALGGAGPDNALMFYMHDILGGSNPTARAVTGVVANPAVTGQVPFAKPNGANLPVSNGVPTNNNNNGIINNNNVPFLVGLGGTTANILQNNGNNLLTGLPNNGNNLLTGLPVANGGQLPTGSALQNLMFGTMTVIDDELTEGHELGSGLIGKAQGFYVASAIDGTSQTMAITAMFESGGYEDSISFFGVHRTAASESHLAIMGGTGKYINARGFAIVKTFAGASGLQLLQQQQPHQLTDGLEAGWLTSFVVVVVVMGSQRDMSCLGILFVFL
ncbi:PREDICTED: dirigent protein 25 [Tarenaya hassleriana]|uniref:dirigent protein 25 n=1 Tax=Tarenaya hassleriana TaxID=28532 RepID=UPI00053C691B|nr:PREDICTED: dirigent protein 25 [Tarenaya hassleriana]